MSKIVDISHFKFIKPIGEGTHSVIWLVEKRILPLNLIDENEIKKDEHEEEKAIEG